jgi:LmbE family N-acetylglucosaminyl deacetylase
MRILALSPHTDDVELGAGGSIARWINEGCDVDYWYFSDCDTPEIPVECRRSLYILGIKYIQIPFGLYPRRKFYQHRDEILQNLYNVHDQYDLVLVPATGDCHQDHVVITEESVRAFKCSILGYELPWNNLGFDGRYFVKLHIDDFNKKIEALSKYKSQKDRKYMKRDYLMAWAYFRGVQANYDLAEAFEVIRWIS